jgi:hypothetical protein
LQTAVSIFRYIPILNQNEFLSAIGLMVACTVVKPTMPPAIVVKNTNARKIRRRNFASAFTVEFTILSFREQLPLAQRISLVR